MTEYTPTPEQSRILVKAIADIKQATLDGKVCDDVAWFSQIETLHDFCDRILDLVSAPSGSDK
jgi:hypothetical protein